MRPAPLQAARRRASRSTTVAAALLLAATAAITPAHAALPASVPTGADDAPSSLLSAPVPDRASSRAAIDAHSLSPGEVRLDATPTVREGSISSARKPQVVSRSARLWLSTEDGVGWSIPDEQYVTVFDVKQDVPGKKITITAEYDAAPTSGLNTFVDIYLGKWDKDETCVGTGNARITALGHGAVNDALFLKAGSTTSIGAATRALSGSVLTVTATGNGAGVDSYDCAFGYLEAVVADSKSEPLRRTWAEDFDAVIEKAPKFDFYSSDLNAAYPGKWNKVYINVRNDGDATAKNVKLKLSGKNLSFKKKTIKLGTIKPGKSKKINARVKLKGKKTRAMSVKATAKGKWSAKAKTKVGHRPHPKKVSSLAGKGYWGYFTGTGGADIWQVRGLHFVNKNWVYVGQKSSGKLPKCSSKVKECQRYSYNRSSGQVKIGKIRGKVDSEGIKITKAPKKSDLNKLQFYPLTKPKKNAKIKAKLEYIDGSGMCWSGSCSSWWRNITLKKNGTFTWTRGSISTFGFPPYQTIHSSSGPDLAGTYKVLSKGRIQFTYTDPETGKRERDVYTIGIDANALGKHKPKHGLLIGAMPHT